MRTLCWSPVPVGGQRRWLVALALVAVGCSRFGLAQAAEPVASQTVTVDELAAALRPDSGQKPLVIHVGFHGLFEEARIPGAVDVGPGDSTEGLAALERKLRSIPSTSEVVLYCGCCPWDHCPNIRPALALAQKLGFSHVRVLMIPKSFRNDWTKRGFPIESGG